MILAQLRLDPFRRNFYEIGLIILVHAEVRSRDEDSVSADESLTGSVKMCCGLGRKKEHVVPDQAAKKFEVGNIEVHGAIIEVAALFTVIDRERAGLVNSIQSTFQCSIRQHSILRRVCVGNQHQASRAMFPDSLTRNLGEHVFRDHDDKDTIYTTNHRTHDGDQYAIIPTEGASSLVDMSAQAAEPDVASTDVVQIASDAGSRAAARKGTRPTAAAYGAGMQRRLPPLPPTARWIEAQKARSS